MLIGAWVRPLPVYAVEYSCGLIKELLRRLLNLKLMMLALAGVLVLVGLTDFLKANDESGVSFLFLRENFCLTNV